MMAVSCSTEAHLAVASDGYCVREVRGQTFFKDGCIMVILAGSRRHEAECE